MKWKKQFFWSNLRCVSLHLPEGAVEYHEHFGQNNSRPDQNSNHVPPEFKSLGAINWAQGLATGLTTRARFPAEEGEMFLTQLPDSIIGPLQWVKRQGQEFNHSLSSIAEVNA
jgi:hypothetical protein